MKTEQRKLGRAAREKLSQEEVAEQSRLIARRLFTRPEYQKARSLFCYLDAGNEVETGEIIQTALEEGKVVAVPLVLEDRRDLRAVPIRDPRRDLAPGFRGIREPVDRSAPGIDPRELDLAIVPGTAFDPAGNRLGRGAGYYDRFLPRLRAGVPRVGLAFECQIIEETAPAHHDVPMSFIVTEDRTIEPEENNRRR
jgi:5-formyltetrahydrofolate cyclo-ligase